MAGGLVKATSPDKLKVNKTGSQAEVKVLKDWIAQFTTQVGSVNEEDVKTHAESSLKYADTLQLAVPSPSILLIL